MTTTTRINASIVQDAFHYALAAIGGSWRGLEDDCREWDDPCMGGRDQFEEKF